MLCWYQRLQDVVQRSNGLYKSLFLPERSTTIFSSSLASVWPGKQQGYKHCLERALGIPEFVGRRASAVVEGWMQQPWPQRFPLQNFYLSPELRV